MPKDAFICYETTTGLGYAKHLKEALRKMGKTAFVADEDINKGEILQEIIDETIKECKYFIAIVTYPALKSEEVKREINLAQSFNRAIIPCKNKQVDRSSLSHLPIINELLQIDFEDKDELVNKVISEIFKRETVKITIESDPSGADVYINGRKVGRT